MLHASDADILNFGDFNHADFRRQYRVQQNLRPGSRRGLRVDEVPLRLDLTCCNANELYERIGCPLAHRTAVRAIALLVANVVEAQHRSPDTAVFYSRDRNHYSRNHLPDRYVPNFYTYTQILAAVAALRSAALIDHDQTAPSAFAKLRSRIRARPKLLALCDDIPIVSRPKEVIVRKDSSGRPVPYDDCRAVDRMRRDVCMQNEVIATLCVRISHDCEVRDESGRLYREFYAKRSLCRPFRRIFNGGWSSGGRWYGPPWQYLPKRVREKLLIRGEPVIEVDYKTCHPRLLCALAGIDLPFYDDAFDYYDLLSSVSREHVKPAFSILLNARSESAAAMALAEDLAITVADAQRLISDVRRVLPGLQQSWRPGIGLHLQFRDSQICCRVQRMLRRIDVPVLSVHDSFLVAQRYESVLRQVMEDAMEAECRQLR
jgi:hypothetical protein